MVDQHLVNLLVKLAVAASVASLLVRFTVFKKFLLREERSLRQRLVLALSISAVFGSGVALRVFTGVYMPADMGLEASVIAGLVGGYVCGLVTGVLLSLPAMFNGEILSTFLFAGVGVLGGLLRDVAPDPELIWRVSPFPDLNIYNVIRNRANRKLAVFHLGYFSVLVSIEFFRLASERIFGSRFLFTLYPKNYDIHSAEYLAAWFTTIFAIVIPLKIWGNARTEQKLVEQQQHLQEARLRALTSQINPHFLFNTLNSIAALVRTDPVTARSVIVKLSKILRGLMRKGDNFISLREELAFIDDYLSIEKVRFGDKLRVIKEIDPTTLDLQVPSMLLQPLVENSLKHGLSNKVEGGTIRLRAHQGDGRLHLLVEDDGVGIPEARLQDLFELGIGISNVNERLKVLFGTDYRMSIDSKANEGTRAEIEIPIAVRHFAVVS